MTTQSPDKESLALTIEKERNRHETYQSAARDKNREVREILLQLAGYDGEKEHTSHNGLLTVRQVSRMLHIHANTVRRWSDLGVLKSFRLGPRGDRRFKLEDVISFVLPE